MGVNWAVDASKYALQFSYSGIIAEGLYCGIYNWTGARGDLRNAERREKSFGLIFDDSLKIWKATHDFIEANFDLIEAAADQLNMKKVLGSEYWEETVLLSR